MIPRFSSVVPSVLAAALLTACSNTDLIREVERSKPSGDAFAQALYGEYVGLAKSEEAQGDLRDAKLYVMKAKDAAGGKVVAAETSKTRDLKGSSQEKALMAAEAQFADAIKGGAAKRNPKGAAKAQAMLECWMEQGEEDFQPAHIAKCREGFKVAMASLAAPAKKKVSKGPSGSPFTVYFKFNSNELTETSQGAIFDIMQKLGTHKPKTVRIVAHADKSGAAKYNKALSEMRAAALEKMLKDAGAKKINTSAMGDTEPLVDTDKPNQTNRRAVIVFN